VNLNGFSRIELNDILHLFHRNDMILTCSIINGETFPHELTLLPISCPIKIDLDWSIG